MMQGPPPGSPSAPAKSPVRARGLWDRFRAAFTPKRFVPAPLPDLEKAVCKEIPFVQLIPSNESEIAAGAEGKVFKAKYGPITVAVKTQHTPDVPLFMRELKILARLSFSPYIVPLVGACTKPPQMAVVTTYFPLGNLDRFIHDRGFDVGWELVLLMACDICKGMLSLDQEGLFHRDLKPTNILVSSYSTLDDDVRLKLCDFGNARDAAGANMTRAVGTCQYMAPEAFTTKYDKRVDYFSFGLVLWEMITQKRPFGDISNFLIPVEVMKGVRPPFPPNFPPELQNLITSLWAADPAARPDFAVALAVLERELYVVREDPASYPDLVTMRT
eukprot:TRINITY_DN8442_c2_g2_i1.p1 TRINITY_DN8442_c2_g2~~TRINITY_DN8442_c2_g2_i1.p1  ORF type:complete len:330 (+),score=61.92 TRINITY_DN8442_c2_g2_i1:147-1136(+)